MNRYLAILRDGLHLSNPEDVCNHVDHVAGGQFLDVFDGGVLQGSCVVLQRNRA